MAKTDIHCHVNWLDMDIDAWLADLDVHDRSKLLG